MVRLLTQSISKLLKMADLAVAQQAIRQALCTLAVLERPDKETLAALAIITPGIKSLAVAVEEQARLAAMAHKQPVAVEVLVALVLTGNLLELLTLVVEVAEPTILALAEQAVRAAVGREEP